MYVTRPLSLYRTSPDAAYEAPPEGPNSGYLVLQDEEYEAQARCCFGLCKDPYLKKPPFPQNRKLTTQYTTGAGENQHTSSRDVFFIPVLNQPLSSNRYYVIFGDGRNKGKTSTCSKEEDMSTCCFCRRASDIEPRDFDHNDIYQQVEIIPHRYKGEFYAKSVAPDGFPRYSLRRKGWKVYTSHPHNYQLGEASGLNTPLRARMPDFNFPIHTTTRSQAVVVGKWYCPFMFVKEEGQLKDQMKRSMFYEMTLEQFWEEIYTCENYHGGKTVEVNVSVRREMAMLYGNEAVQDENNVINGVMWFKPVTSVRQGLGLSLAIVERMRWEVARGGWDGGKERVERVERAEVFKGVDGEWKKFGCYVLVERFALKRMDGSLALTYEFKHTNKIQNKWE